MEEYLMLNEEPEQPRIITRLSRPTEWDMLPKGQIISVIIPDPFEEELWIQRSRDSNHPLWEKI